MRLWSNDNRTRFVLAVVNKSPVEAVDFRPDFKGLHLKIPGKITGTVLCGTTPDDFNDIGAEDRVIPDQKQFEIINGAISLQSHSLVFFLILSNQNFPSPQKVIYEKDIYSINSDYAGCM